MLIFLIILLNVAISWWNCYAVGQVWNDTKRYGSGFDKALIYSAAIQSMAGFSIPILLALTWVFTGFLTLGDEPASPETIAAIWSGVMNLWYVAIIIPVVGSGFIIWGHSMKVAWENRDPLSIGLAGWNTFAQVSNTVSMVNNLGGAFGKVGDAFRSSKDNMWMLIFMLVVVSLMSSALLTVYLIRYYAAKTGSLIRSTAG